ncbi:hypothetical protein [Pontiella sp.]|uniref:hypothetical protein n=1 Tax=Pontiella sp. TaxID=2837462 RepID=UPI0035637147
MKMSWILSTVFLGALVSGCTSPKQVTIDKDGYGSVIVYKADQRGAYFIRRLDGTIAVLSEPSPDVTKEFKGHLDALIKSAKSSTNAQVKAGFETQVVDLAKRSQTLQILREALFRLSEMNANGGISPEARMLYERALKAVELIALTELGNSNLPDSAKERAVDDFYSKVKQGSLTATDTEKKDPKSATSLTATTKEEDQ